MTIKKKIIFICNWGIEVEIFWHHHLASDIWPKRQSKLKWVRLEEFAIWDSTEQVRWDLTDQDPGSRKYIRKKRCRKKASVLSSHKHSRSGNWARIPGAHHLDSQMLWIQIVFLDQSPLPWLGVGAINVHKFLQGGCQEDGGQSFFQWCQWQEVMGRNLT